MRYCSFVFVLLLYLIFLVYHVSCYNFFETELWAKIFNFTKFVANNKHSLIEEEPRKKKNGGKYIIPLLFGAIMIKSIIFPLAIKAMAVMSAIAVFMSTLSLIVSSIVGYAKLAWKSKAPSIKVVHVNDNYHHETWAKDDEIVPANHYNLESVDFNPYEATVGYPY